MPPIRQKSYGSTRKTKSTRTAKLADTPKLRKYSRPSYLYVTLMAICRIAQEAVDEQGFTIQNAIQKVYDMSKTGNHTLGKRANQSIEDYILIFRHYGYLLEVGYLRSEEEEISILFQTQDILKELVELVEKSITDSGEEPSKNGREVFVALSTHLRKTVTPDNLRQITTMYRNSKGQQQLMYENLVLQTKVKELEAGLAPESSEMSASHVMNNDPPSSQSAVRPAPRRLGELAGDSFYTEDVQREISYSATTPVRPSLASTSSNATAYPSPASLPRPRGGPSSQPESPSRGYRGIRTPPSSPRSQHDDGDDDDDMLVNTYLRNPSESLQSVPEVPCSTEQVPPVPPANGGRSRTDRRLAALKKLRRRNERIQKAHVAARKDLIKQRAETRRERAAGQEKDVEISRINGVYNTLLAELRAKLGSFLELPFL